MIEKSTLMNEVSKITKDGPKDVHYLYEMWFQLPDGNTIAPLKFMSVDIVRDFTQSFADEIVMEVVFGAGTYSQKVFPQRNNLKAVIQRQYIGEISDTVSANAQVETLIYTAILMDVRDHAKEGSSPMLDSVQMGDLGDVIKVNFQLIDNVTEWLRGCTVGGVFKQATPWQVLQSMLADESNKMPLERGLSIEAIDMVEADNTEKRAHVVIPHGTPLVALPSYIQDKCGGIYNSEIGFYLHQGSWYVWPLFNTQRFEATPSGLTVINVPENRFPEVERTFRQTANQLIILATGSTRSVDSSNARQVGEGNGFRLTDAKAIFDSFGKTIDNVTTLSRGKNVTEVLFEEAKNGLNHVVQAADKISSNLMSALSKISSRKGQPVQVKWENSRGSLIYPGMPVRYLYEAGGETKELFGVVTMTQDYIHLKGTGSTTRRYASNTSLTLFLEPDKNEQSS
jgi:hypothetical protein